jgi:TRAP-type mannitol/chloroaromatic compound transport system permease large subunit
MFFGIIAVLLLGFPVAFTLAGTSLIFGLDRHVVRGVRPVEPGQPGRAAISA